MQLGVVVTDERYAIDATVLLRTARDRGWATRCFLTDRGVLALGHSELRQVAEETPGSVAVCELSVERFGEGIPPDALSDPVVIGGQYQNAELVHTSDKVIVF
jgi:hypothetical protein